MKVVCINNLSGGRPCELAIGKVYEVLRQETNYYLLTDNNIGSRYYYRKSFFTTIDEIRDKKLNDLGI